MGAIALPTIVNILMKYFTKRILSKKERLEAWILYIRVETERDGTHKLQWRLI